MHQSGWLCHVFKSSHPVRGEVGLRPVRWVLLTSNAVSPAVIGDQTAGQGFRMVQLPWSLGQTGEGCHQARLLKALM